MARYVDGFLLPVSKKNLEAYRRMAEEAGNVWRECIAEDVTPGEFTSFPQSVPLKEDETVVFSSIVSESRHARDRINEQVMKDPRIANMDPESMPFDGKRMFWGGYEVLIKL